MKVGILTFHRATNYGTALQAFATEKGIKKLGVDTEIIDYRPEYIERTLKVRKLRNAKSIKEILSIVVNAVLYPGMAKRKVESFKRFFSLMEVSKKACLTIDEVAELAQEYDAVLSGSDQLFNRNITGDDMTYFLPFEHRRKLSFASSFGERSLSKERIGEIAPFFSDFDSLSVREKTALDILLNIKAENPNAKEATSVLDPTFLLTKDDWDKYASESLKLPKDGYILTYYMIETELLCKITNELQKRTGLKVVNIKPSKKQVILHQGKNLAFAGPAEFLACYKNASYVVTNSFHGTAFAINYGIPFFTSTLPVSMAGEVNSRLCDICELFDLSHRWIDSEQKLSVTDFTKPFEKETEKILSNLREHSFEYLKDALEL
ncbi:MAG: polysaccharide pyruvyl transferase family protein [Ruminococcus sp.]|nr:polysaccharide pyruvyl transferase family protein [Ruminococcus sp.]